MAEIRDLLPERHSPLRADGAGNVVYLVAMSFELANVLIRLAGVRDPLLSDTLEIAEIDATAPDETTRVSLVNARIGQGIFRQRVLKLEPVCRMTKTSDPALLLASHIKSWKDSSNDERLSEFNGLMLAPHVDRLFDRGLISFADDGTVLLSGAGTATVLEQWSLSSVKNVGTFTTRQQEFLAFHRERWGYAV